jgi:phosphoribosylformylglycinamidine cyclo-ligase
MEFMAQVGQVPQASMERTWNCGIGMVAIVAPAHADRALATLAARGMKAWVCGSVQKRQSPGDLGAILEGNYKAR